jgi:hypothetical protein
VSLLLHKEYRDGSVEHEQFTQAAWEEAMHLKSLRTFWGHAPDNCVDPLHDLLAANRRRGYRMTAAQHALADRVDPGWSGDRNSEVIADIGEVLAPGQEPAEPGHDLIAIAQQLVEFPPPPPQSRVEEIKLMSEMSGMCTEDVRSIFWRKLESQLEKLPPVVEKTGQFRLF